MAKYMWLILWAESTACLIFVTFTISDMVSNFGFGRQQVPCYLSEFIAFKCYFCHVFVMCSFNNWMKLSAKYWSQSSWAVTLYSKFGAIVHYISEPIAERSTSYLCTTWTAVWTCPYNNDEIPQPECCWWEEWKIPVVSECRQHEQ